MKDVGNEYDTLNVAVRCLGRSTIFRTGIILIRRGWEVYDTSNVAVSEEAVGG